MRVARRGRGGGRLCWHGAGRRPEATQRFDGRGRVGRTGQGFVDVTTVAQLADSAPCGAPLSGTTTLTAGGATAVIAYDGARDCDARGSAPWTYNREPQGLLIGAE